MATAGLKQGAISIDNSNLVCGGAYDRQQVHALHGRQSWLALIFILRSKSHAMDIFTGWV